MVVAELAGVPLTAVAISRVSYEVASSPAPAAGRRLRRLLASSDGYSTLLVRATLERLQVTSPPKCDRCTRIVPKWHTLLSALAPLSSLVLLSRVAQVHHAV